MLSYAKINLEELTNYAPGHSTILLVFYYIMHIFMLTAYFHVAQQNGLEAVARRYGLLEPNSECEWKH